MEEDEEMQDFDDEPKTARNKKSNFFTSHTFVDKSSNISPIKTETELNP